MNKEEIEKAKEKLNKYADKVNRNKRILEGSEIQTSEAINTLLQYIDQLEEIKGMKEAIELAGMDIKSLLNFKYENKKLKNKIDQLEQENKTLKQCLIDNNTKDVNEHLYLGNTNM